VARTDLGCYIGVSPLIFTAKSNQNMSRHFEFNFVSTLLTEVRYFFSRVLSLLFVKVLTHRHL
jgi:hypothetical protein